MCECEARLCSWIAHEEMSVGVRRYLADVPEACCLVFGVGQQIAPVVLGV